MNSNTKYSFKSIIILGVFFAFIGFLLSLIPVLAGNNWSLTGLKLTEFSFISPIIILAISFAASISLSTLSNLNEEFLKFPNIIKDVTTGSVDRLKHDINEFKEKLSSGIVKHEDYTYRALIYYEGNGEIRNGFAEDKQSSRNILFSNKTINLIFREIKELKPGALRDIGKKSSNRFAIELVSSIFKKQGPADLYNWMQHWITFDSGAGFGKFDLVPENSQKWKETLTIVLKHSFLTTDTDTGYSKSDQKICDFITGYIEGIINHFPHEIFDGYDLKPGKIIVTHDIDDPNECISAGRNPNKGCVFHFKS